MTNYNPKTMRGIVIAFCALGAPCPSQRLSQAIELPCRKACSNTLPTWQ